MRLFLGGGGNSIDSFELDKKFVASLDLSKPILYIPIAISSIKHPYPECLEWVLSVFKIHSVTNIIMWNEEDLKNKVKEDFDKFSGVYIGGGNTYKLLKELKEFGTLKIISLLAQEGLPIYGGSAGAIILAKTIFPAGYADTNEVRVTDFSALNLIHEHDVWCHYIEDDNDSIIEYLAKYNLEKILAIPENAGLFVTEDSIEIVGPGMITLFKNDFQKVLNPGELVVY